MIKYHTRHDTRIEEVDVLRETEHRVFFASDWPCYDKGRPEAKHTENDQNYFDTWQEARQFLIDREKTTIADLANQIDQHQTTLQKIEEMQE